MSTKKTERKYTMQDRLSAYTGSDASVPVVLSKSGGRQRGGHEKGEPIREFDRDLPGAKSR